MKDTCSVDDPVYTRAFGEAVRQLERDGELDRLCPSGQSAGLCLLWARSYRQRAAEAAFPAAERWLLEQAERYEQLAKAATCGAEEA